MRALILGLLAVPLAGCIHQIRNTSADGATAVVTDALSQSDAKARAQIVDQIEYQMRFDFTGQDENYMGAEKITFTVVAPGRDLRLDFTGGTVKRVALNGQPLDVLYNGQYIGLPGHLFKSGLQILEIDFVHPYGHEGRGLSRFQDPLDKKVYIHTQFEPFSANRAFPCFDQPDLKATYALSALVPKSWQVITSNRETEVKDQAENKEWIFPKSARFSTYLFSLHAGPFAKWEDKSFRIPLRLFARQSLAKYVNPKEWLPITRHGFDFYESYFSTPYPFKKYDQILVPEFSSGAMENVAAVTFSERFVSRGAKTRAQIRGLADVILHEMAHMWFGDLVTMRWWGDLWLNESFATYMATQALSNHPEFKEAWQSFFAGKGRAYYEDQMTTTHAISGKIENTNEALTNFDSITYAKGASVLQQLAFMIGEEAFKKGLKIYFDRYAEKNTDAADFFSAMTEASNRNLASWRQIWFETPGLNAISVSFQCANGQISQMAVLQTAPNGPAIIRPHNFEIALMRRTDGKVNVTDVLSVQSVAPTTFVPAAIGKSCPHVVYPNYGDHDYFKVRLDDASVNTLKYSLNSVTDPLLRHQLWHALWDKVRDAEFSFVAFGDLLVPEALAAEHDELILRQLTRSASAILDYYRMSDKLGSSDLKTFAENLERQVWQRLTQAKPGSNDQLVWVDALSDLFTTPWGLGKLKRVLRGQEGLRGVTLDQDRRWDFVNAISRAGDPEAMAIIAREAKRDPSSRGEEERIGSLVARPVWEEKMKWVEAYKISNSRHSMTQFRSAFWNMFPTNQVKLRERFAPQFFQDLLWVNQNRDGSVAGLFTALAPSECRPETAGRLDEFVAAHQNLQPVLVKSLKMASQEYIRCRKILALAESGGRFSAP